MDLTRYLEDAAHFPGGHAAGVEAPRSADELAAVVRSDPAVLPIGAQSSLTGGATPMGELVLSTERMNRIVSESARSITVEPGITIAALQEHLAARGAWFPPAPTFTGAFAGGVVATNAAGASTFKYGSTRKWVEALTVVLADGTAVPLTRGDARAADGSLTIAGRRVPVPRYTMPAVVKKSAGYFAQTGMDAVDLFIGSEGTLGVIVEITFRILSPAPQLALALIPCRSTEQALRLAGALRQASIDTWRSRDPRGVDVSAIENIDARCIEIVQQDGAADREHVTFPPGTEMALFVQLELPPSTTPEAAYDEIAAAHDDDAPDTPLVRFCRMVAAEGLLDVTELAMPGDVHRFAQLVAVREAVPAGVNQRVGIARHTIDDRIAKTAADMIVPFEHFAEMNRLYREGFESRGLDYAIWGHISDGNVHPNVIPRSYGDVERGREAILEFGRHVARLGGCPLAEHGVGRSAIKQELLRQLYGDEGIAQMRAVKGALDPGGKLAPGVIFSNR